jgi:DNA-binding CsgD family transcriptional regulator
VLAARLDLSVSRQLLRRIVEVTLGNPLFVLELGHTLIQMGVPEIGEDMPVPGGVEEILGTRVASLTPPLRRLLIAVALTANPRTAELAALEGSKALDDAVDAGLLVVVRDRVRASHPLIAAAAKSNAPRAQVRALHVALAKVLSDPELRAMHMALAADRPQADLADTVAQAASRATARGAREQALALAEHALRLTPPDAAVRSERVLRLAGYLETAGEMQRMTDLLTAELEHVPAGLPRARAWLMLSEGTGPRSLEDIQSYRAYALAECPEDPGLRAVVLAKRACNDAASAVMRIGEAETCALEAVSHARRAGSAVERTALYALAWARAMAGRPVDDLCEAARTADDSAAYIAASPERVAGQRLVWRGEIDLARATLTHFLALADERGERESYALQRLHMCELSLRVGDFDDAQALLDEWAESSDRALMFRPKYERCRALLAAGRGAVDEARRWGEVALERSVSTGSRWDGLETLRALGIAALLEHKPDLAVASLREVWDHTEREGVQDPGVFPVAPELIEALAELGELEPARSVSARLRELAEREDHPWGRLTADRCDGLTALAGERYDPAAADTLERAAVGYAQRGLRLDAARALLSLGRAQRRLKQWGGARRSLEQAAALFEQMAAPGWAAQAQSQIARVGARRPKASGELTATERRTAELAASGLSNKEIAEQLVVTVHTVEVHLSRAYAKLGIRSRGQLSGRLFG